MHAPRQPGRGEARTVTLLQDLLGRAVVVSDGVVDAAVLHGESGGAEGRSKTRTGQQANGSAQPERVPAAQGREANGTGALGALSDTIHESQLFRRCGLSEPGSAMSDTGELPVEVRVCRPCSGLPGSQQRAPTQGGERGLRQSQRLGPATGHTRRSYRQGEASDHVPLAISPQLLLPMWHHPHLNTDPQECPALVYTQRTHPRPRASPGPGCENWESRSSASTPPPHVTQGSQTWHWWESSRSQPPGPAGRPPAEECRAFTHLPGLPSWAGALGLTAGLPSPCSSSPA